MSHLVLEFASVSVALAWLRERLEDDEDLAEEGRDPVREARRRVPHGAVLLCFRKFRLSSIVDDDHRDVRFVEALGLRVLHLGAREVVNHNGRDGLDDEHRGGHGLHRVVDVEAGKTQLEERNEVFRARGVDAPGDERGRDGREGRDDRGRAMGLVDADWSQWW